MSRPPNQPRQYRVLLLEDEALIAMDLEQWLTELGCEVVGPFRRSGEAMAALDRVRVDIALLDYLLDDGTGGIVADRLERLCVPYLFLTGCRELMARDGRNGAPILGKPVSEQQMLEAIESLCARARDGARPDAPSAAMRQLRSAARTAPPATA